MSTIKKLEKVIIPVLVIAGIPLIVPFLANIVEMILKTGRIIGTIIRIY
jgi:hypothetical protein